VGRRPCTLRGPHESAARQLPPARLLALSPSGEIAIARATDDLHLQDPRSRTPDGRPPRRSSGRHDADWAPGRNCRRAGVAAKTAQFPRESPLRDAAAQDRVSPMVPVAFLDHQPATPESRHGGPREPELAGLRHGVGSRLGSGGGDLLTAARWGIRGEVFATPLQRVALSPDDAGAPGSFVSRTTRRTRILARGGERPGPRGSRWLGQFRLGDGSHSCSKPEKARAPAPVIQARSAPSLGKGSGGCRGRTWALTRTATRSFSAVRAGSRSFRQAFSDRRRFLRTAGFVFRPRAGRPG
jgi:hypothetical protein